jgi:serine/threonine-protein kinase RsbW
MRAEPDTPAWVSFTVPARAESLVVCRLALAGLTRTRCIDPEVVADLKLALTEACTNSIRHAYRDGGGAVSVRIELTDDHLAVEVEDVGAGFVTPDPPAPRHDPRGTGMGLALIRALTDDLNVSRGPDGRGSLVRFRRGV